MHRWDPVNPRQLAPLKRISAGEDLSGPDDVPEQHSARALRNRGLVEISKRRGTWKAVISEAGRFYLEHDHRRDPSANEVIARAYGEMADSGSENPSALARLLVT